MFPDEKICFNKDALPYKDLGPPQSREINDERTQTRNNRRQMYPVHPIARPLGAFLLTLAIVFASSHFFPERLYTDERSYASFHRPQTFQ